MATTTRSMHPLIARGIDSLRALERDFGRKAAKLDGPWHLGAPLALDAIDQLRAARWCTARALESSEPPNADARAQLAAVDRFLEAPSSVKPEELASLGFKPAIGDSGKLAWRLVSAAATIAKGSGRGADKWLRNCVITAVAVAFGSKRDVPGFLHELDAELMRLEAESLLRGVSPASKVRVEAVLFRAAKPVVRVVRIGPDRFGTLVKRGAKAQWTEGSRDDALSAVPDALFKAATAAVR